MKKYIIFLLIACMMILAACGKISNTASETQLTSETSSESSSNPNETSESQVPDNSTTSDANTDDSQNALTETPSTSTQSSGSSKSNSQTNKSSSETQKPAVVAVSSVLLSKSSLTLEPGGTANLTATVSPNNATDKSITWSSDKNGIATIFGGTVTAKSEGTATITATAGGKSASCTITVNETAEKSIYDRPYDIAAMEEDMKKHVIANGKTYLSDMDLDTCGHWADPLYTSSYWYGQRLEDTLKSQMSFYMTLDYDNFRLYCLPLGGEYKIHVLCG